MSLSLSRGWECHRRRGGRRLASLWTTFSSRVGRCAGSSRTPLSLPACSLANPSQTWLGGRPHGVSNEPARAPPPCGPPAARRSRSLPPPPPLRRRPPGVALSMSRPHALRLSGERTHATRRRTSRGLREFSARCPRLSPCRLQRSPRLALSTRIGPRVPHQAPVPSRASPNSSSALLLKSPPSPSSCPSASTPTRNRATAFCTRPRRTSGLHLLPHDAREKEQTTDDWGREEGDSSGEEALCLALLGVAQVVVLDRPRDEGVACNRSFIGRQCVCPREGDETRRAREGGGRTGTDGDGKVHGLLREALVAAGDPVRDGAAHRGLAEGRDDCCEGTGRRARGHDQSARCPRGRRREGTRVVP